MIARAGGRRSRGALERGRVALFGAAVALLVVALLPPVGSLAREHAFVGALQFGLFATVVPASVVVASPWGLAWREGAWAVVRAWATRTAAQRLRHRSPGWSAGYVLFYVAATIGWRTPAAVDALVRLPALSLLEAATLVVAGVLLWLELVPASPFVPRSAFPVRIALAAVAMWVTWIMAYLLGMSHSDWFTAYHHTPGAGLSLIADQQLAAGMLWLLAAVGFVPLVFATLVVWLRTGEDLDEELRKVARAERRTWSPPVRERRRGESG